MISAIPWLRFYIGMAKLVNGDSPLDFPRGQSLIEAQTDAK